MTHYVFRTLALAVVIPFALCLAGCSTSSFDEEQAEMDRVLFNMREQNYASQCFLDATMMLLHLDYLQADNEGNFVRPKFQVCNDETNDCWYTESAVRIAGGIRVGNTSVYGNSVSIEELEPGTINITEYCPNWKPSHSYLD